MRSIRIILVAVVFTALAGPAPAQGPQVVSVWPAQNATDAPRDATLRVQFDRAMDGATIHDGSFVLHSSFYGRYCSGDDCVSYDAGTDTYEYDPDLSFRPGERLIAVLTLVINDDQGQPMDAPFVWSFTAASDPAAALFLDEGGPYPAEANPIALACASLNWGYDLDLVSANHQANSITVFNNSGSGNFGTSHTFSTGTSPWDVAVLDYDHNTLLDLATPDFTDNTVTVFKNSNYYDFTTSSAYAVDSDPRSLCTGDFDGDGNMDLAATGSGNDRLSILLNDGAGGFILHDSVPSAAKPYGIACGDFDLDGSLDLAVAHNDGASVGVYHNDGFGNFSAGPISSTSGTPKYLAAADFDQDGDLDLAVSLTAGNLNLYYNDGAGNMGSPVIHDESGDFERVVAADLDGDGDPDLAVSDQSNDTVRLFTNHAGLFIQEVSVGYCTDAFGLCAGDLDGDGTLDLAVSSQSNGEIYILFNDATPAVTAVSPDPRDTDVAAESNVTATFDRNMDGDSFQPLSFMVEGDIGGARMGTVSYTGGNSTATFDPDLDFAPGERVTASLTGMIADSNGIPLLPPYVWQFRAEAGPGPGEFAHFTTVSAGSDPWDIARGDLNGDGWIDLVVADPNYGAGQVLVLMADGAGGFQTAASYSASATPWSLILYDLEGDGWLDVVGSDPAGDLIFTYGNDGTGTLSNYTVLNLDPGSSPRDLIAGDLSGNGVSDLALLCDGDDRLRIFHNQWGSLEEIMALPAGADPLSPAVGDLDGDGDLDLIWADDDPLDQGLRLARNDAYGYFSAPEPIALGSAPRGLALGDLDDDGDADLLVGHAGYSIYVLSNDGAGEFSILAEHPVSGIPEDIVIADLDGDGDLDGAASCPLSNSVDVLRNEGGAVMAPEPSWWAGPGCRSLCAGDLNGDLDLDLAVVNAGVGQLQLLSNFTLIPYVESVSPAQQAFAVAADTSLTVTFGTEMDESSLDHKIIVWGEVSGAHSGDLSYDAGSRRATFVPHLPFDPGEQVTVRIHPAVQSGDGNFMAESFSWSFRVEATGSPGNVSDSFSYDMVDFLSVYAGDLNGDQLPDLALGTESSRLWIMFNQGDGSMGDSLYYTVSGGPRDIDGADLDGDGDTDLVSAGGSSSNQSVSVLINEGGGIFAAAVDYPLDSYYDPHAVEVADFDGDGILDIAASLQNRDEVAILRGDGTGGFSPTAGAILPNDAEGLWAGDLDGDGRYDLAVTSLNDDVVFVLRGEGYGVFQHTGSYSVRRNPFTVRAADLDGDGAPELAAPAAADDEVWIYRNLGGVDYGDSLILGVGNYPTSICVGNVRGDQALDLVVANSQSPYGIHRLQNDGAGGFSMADTLIFDSRIDDMALADFNRDGVLDLVLASNNGSGNIDDVYVLLLDEATAVDEAAGAPPATVELAQNHPNPFNPSTEIAFGLPQAGRVSLTVYDLRGRRVMNLLDEKLPAGRYAIAWEGRDEADRSVASGVYFARLQTAAGSRSIKMLLAK